MPHLRTTLLLLTLAFATPAFAAEADLLSKDRLGAALRQGGLVLYMRHGVTIATQTDFWQQGGDWDRATLNDCTRQRNLSEAGREQLRRMGEAVTKLKLTWGPVLASPYCRTRETAQAAFGKFETSWDLFYNVAARSKRREDGDAILNATERMLSTPPPAGSNAVLVGHGGNLASTAGVYLAEGESAVFRPGANGKYTLVGRILQEDWASLAPAATPRADSERDRKQRNWVFRQADLNRARH